MLYPRGSSKLDQRYKIPVLFLTSAGALCCFPTTRIIDSNESSQVNRLISILVESFLLGERLGENCTCLMNPNTLNSYTDIKEHKRALSNESRRESDLMDMKTRTHKGFGRLRYVWCDSLV